ncbi:hypothetical protein [Rivularia sp. UHCC 0363]|uniref:hypothetical protein n=1 Tax=Rivularia sp. UHCC 0363 TaxID=3110244 RepID=UPI002B22125B|nr:hypothetical protein [Rivularia sp. UHCC 0363]MEA5593092.1 hypothetical protein [Rivularia sp. UHCC 0363]
MTPKALLFRSKSLKVSHTRLCTLWVPWAKSSYSFSVGFQVEAEPLVMGSQPPAGNQLMHEPKTGKFYQSQHPSHTP